MEWPEVLNTEQAAEFLGTSQASIRRWVQDGTVPGVKIGRNWKFQKAELQKVLDGIYIPRGAEKAQ